MSFCTEDSREMNISPGERQSYAINTKCMKSEPEPGMVV
jgi:hypothetical protein